MTIPYNLQHFRGMPCRLGYLDCASACASADTVIMRAVRSSALGHAQKAAPGKQTGVNRPTSARAAQGALGLAVGARPVSAPRLRAVRGAAFMRTAWHAGARCEGPGPPAVLCGTLR